MGFLAGKSGGVTVGAAVWKLSEWGMDVQTEAIDVTNFESGGFKENIAGLTSAALTFKGKFDSTAMAMTTGTSYSFVLEASGSVSYTVTARVTSIRLTTNVVGAVEVEGAAESTGSFTPSIA